MRAFRQALTKVSLFQATNAQVPALATKLFMLQSCPPTPPYLPTVDLTLAVRKMSGKSESLRRRSQLEIMASIQGLIHGRLNRAWRT
jgi:hypothetical protein